MAVIELETFGLRPGVDEAAFLAADRRVQTEFSYAQPGCLRRTTARGAGGRWLVVTLWESAGAADAAARAAVGDPVASAFTALVGDMSTERFSPLD